MGEQRLPIFFSYSREDSEFALRLAQDLKSAGVPVWLDRLDISPGKRWDRETQQALERCPRVVIILTPSSVQSDNVMDEVSFAMDEGKLLVPVLLKDCRVPLRLRRLQYVDFRKEYNGAVSDLFRALGGDQAQQQVTPERRSNESQTQAGMPVQIEQKNDRPRDSGLIRSGQEESDGNAEASEQALVGPAVEKRPHQRFRAAKLLSLVGVKNSLGRNWILLALVFTACVMLFSLLPSLSDNRQSSGAPKSKGSDNGLSQAERNEYYHLSEGSELVPYALLANLKSVITGRPFLFEMERFGFLPDPAGPANPYGLPVGLAISRSRNRATVGMEMVSFNCAVCHVGELSYAGKRLRIDGAPALVNFQRYRMELKGSLEAVIKNPKELLALLIAMNKQPNTPDAAPSIDSSHYVEDPAVQSVIKVEAASNADFSFHSVSSVVADTQPERSRTFEEQLKINIAILKARLAYLRNGTLLVDGTEPGPGRVDAFGALHNLLSPRSATKMQSPVSFPFIWSVPDNVGRKPEDFSWIHYDGSTNSILERNIGQALAMGAVFSPNTHESTLRIGNLHRLEMLIHKLQPPKWPAEVLGSIDEAWARKGEQIFNEKCASCHQNKLFSQAQTGTDPNRADSFGQAVHVGGFGIDDDIMIPFPQAVAPFLNSLKTRAFADDGLSLTEQRNMDANPVIWRATAQYLARPLNGIWATAPYLHNGSVPTLYDMLHPDQRPVKFPVGSREFDPVKIGYRSDTGAGPNVWIYDTTQPGNSNRGHSGEPFGTTLPEDQKSALLEYLKRF
jgi:mono/diheme cytochrome c family protein